MAPHLFVPAPPRPGRAAWRFCAPLAFLSSSAALLGCASIPSGAAAVDTVDIQGNHHLASSDIEDKIATAESAKFLMLFRGFIVDYTLFDPFVLAKDLERVEAFYRAHGFYEAHARAGRVEYVAKDHVRVTIVVDEGDPVLVRDVVLLGLQGVPAPVARAAESAAMSKLRRGRRFSDEDYESTEKAIERALTDHGFAYAKTTRQAEVDLPGHYALVTYVTRPGPPAKFGPVTIDGLGSLPERVVRRAIDIEPGEVYSTSAIDTAKQAVLDLGVFGGVTITPELPDPPPPDLQVPLHVHVEPSKLHQLTLGGGIEFDPIKTDLHLLGGWEHRNFLGGLRDFKVELRPGVVLYPLRMQTPLDAPTNLLFEEKVRAELRQPGFIEARTAGLLRTELNTFPILLTPQQSGPGVPVLGYFENKEAVGVDRTIGRFYVSPTYNFQHDQPFAYIPPRDPDLGPVNLSYIDLALHLDFRDDKLHPHAGVYIVDDTQFAGLGGDARDIREQPDVRVYVPLGNKVTWGLRATVGFLVPFNSYAAVEDRAKQADPAYRAEWVKESQLLYLRGFFSGGPSSNRGYPLYGVGPHGAVPFFNPQIAASQVANSCRPNDPSFDPSHCAVPEGGMTLWEASTELRIGVSGPFEVAVFCDASDVEQAQFTFRLSDQTRYHVACGLGARYDTPVGPIRLDAGYRIPGLNPRFTDPAVVATDGDPGTIFGIPIAIAFGIGEAF